jgi:zinc transport system permease protein
MIINWLIENDFFIKAILAGLGISIIAGPLGSIIVWNRMTFFGDTLAHSTLLGVALAMIFNVNIYFGLIGICLLASMMLLNFTEKSQLTSDTALNILSSTILAFGLIAATKIKDVRFDLLGYFYGDILAVDQDDIYWILGISLGTLLVLIKLWKWLLLIILHEDLAKVEGIPVARVKLAFVLIMALVFAVTMRLLGMLLIAALFVIPIASARRFAQTPELTAIFGSIFSGIAVISGVSLSLYYDLPTGPTIVIIAAMIFLMSLNKKSIN